MELVDWVIIWSKRNVFHTGLEISAILFCWYFGETENLIEVTTLQICTEW